MGLTAATACGVALAFVGVRPASAAFPQTTIAGAGSAPTPAARILVGNDISWPQCSVARGGYGNPMPADSVNFVVIGLSRGRAFSTNPCLADQVAWAARRRLLVSYYVFPSYPSNAEYARYGSSGPFSTGTWQGRLMNVGYQQAVYWLRVMRQASVGSPGIWVDIEHAKQGNAWTTRPADRNLPLINGVLAGFRQAGLRTGIYTTTSHWKEITGGARLGQPEWRTVGRGASTGQALASCAKPGVQGSPVVLAQYFGANVDDDVLCPGTQATWSTRFFHQY